MPGATQINRGALNWQLGNAANSVLTSFASKIPTTTKPDLTSGNVFDLGQPLGTPPTSNSQQQNTVNIQGQCPTGVQAVFFGVGNDDQTMLARLIGWKQINTLWVPTVLCDLTATLSAVVGVAATTIDNTNRFCDVLSLASGYSTANCVMTSPSGDVIAHATINLDGYSLIEWSFTNNNSSTSANCIWAAY